MWAIRQLCQLIRIGSRCNTMSVGQTTRVSIVAASKLTSETFVLLLIGVFVDTKLSWKISIGRFVSLQRLIVSLSWHVRLRWQDRVDVCLVIGSAHFSEDAIGTHAC